MSKIYEVPKEIRDLEKLIRDFSYSNGYNPLDVFRDFLRYVIHGFSPVETPPMKDWSYKKEQNKIFCEMFLVWVRIMHKQIAIHGWYDAFGILFMALVSKSGQQYKGQFFTPSHICDLMADLVDGKKDIGEKIVDPAAGSGRLLLAAHHRNPRAYLVANDLDYTCCLMTVCNFLMNSCVGEVVCINSLSQKDFRGAWVINEAYYRTNLPSVRYMNEEEYVLFSQTNVTHTLFYDQQTFDSYINYKKIRTLMMDLLDHDGKLGTDGD